MLGQHVYVNGDNARETQSEDSAKIGTGTGSPRN
jgi:hypothetical protein